MQNIYEIIMNELREGADIETVSRLLVEQSNKALDDWEAEKRRAEERKVKEETKARAIEKIVEGMNEYIQVVYGEDFAVVDGPMVQEALERVYGILNAVEVEVKPLGVKSKVDNVDKIINDWIKVLEGKK